MRGSICAISFVLAGLLLVPHVNANPLTFADGGHHIINYNVGENVEVDYGAPGISTSVELATGGSVLYHVYAYEDSYVTVSGGYVGG